MVWLSGIAILTSGALLLVFLRYRDNVPTAVKERAATFVPAGTKAAPAASVRGMRVPLSPLHCVTWSPPHCVTRKCFLPPRNALSWLLRAHACYRPLQCAG